jgi:hypothetical protein
MRSVYLALVGLGGAAGLLLLTAGKSQTNLQAENAERGRYLVEYGGCMDCHTPFKMTANGPAPDMARMLSGHPAEVKLPPPTLSQGPWDASVAGMTAWAGPWGVAFAANLTPDRNTGLGIWTEYMFIKAMRTGKHMGAGRDILPPMPWRNLAGLTDADLKAIYAYLRNIPPVNNRVPDPIPPHAATAFE